MIARFVLLAALFGALFLAALPGVTAAQSPADTGSGGGGIQAYPTPEDVIWRAVEAAGFAYAGDCAATVSPRDIGRTCSSFVAERGDTRAYLTGRTFSEFRSWVFVRRFSDGWRLAGVASLDFFAVEVVIPWPD